MPVQSCQRGGKPGRKWGPEGFCYTGPNAQDQAERQGRAIEANKGHSHTGLSLPVATSAELIARGEERADSVHHPKARPLQVDKDALPVSKGHQPQSIRKVDEELRIVWAEVYVPNFPDTQGDFMTAEEVRKMAHRFMESGQTGQVDVEHDQNCDRGCVVVESFVAREGDPDFIADAWVAAVHIDNDELWEMVKAGEINGFSFMGSGFGTEGTLELDIPDDVTGRTEVEDGHDHVFHVSFSAEGNFLGGSTTPGPNGHIHEIEFSTVTERADGHVHRYSVLDGIV